VGSRARRWLFFVGLTACGIDARGQLEPDDAQASAQPPSGVTDGGEASLDGSVPTDAEMLDAPATDGPTTPSRGRVTNGLIALYELEENGGTVAKDTSGVAPALDLGVPSGVTWIPKALKFDTAAHVKTATAATKIVQRCGATNAITVEAWFEYVNLSDWSRIIAMAESADVGNLAMTSNPWTVGFDLRTSADPYLRTTRDLHDAGTPTTMVHMVETRDAAGVKRVYFDGALVIDATQAGDFSGWDSTYPLSVGNTPALDRPFYGEVHLVAIYDRALTAAEVATNRTAGADP
jgi:hypothetical protein